MSLADRLVTRKEWGAMTPKARTLLKTPRGNTIHYEGPPMGTPQHGECPALVRSIQRFHMNTRGWADIAYSSVVCPHGSVFEGRWLGVRTAAQGANEGNRTHYAHCYLGGKGDPLTAEGRAGMKDVLAFFRANGSGIEVKAHREWRPTECPGEALVELVADKVSSLSRITPSLSPGGVPGAVGFMARPGGGGWIVAGDGGVFSTGPAFFGSQPDHGDTPIVAGAGTPSGQGYWLVDAVGHVFPFGDAGHFGPDQALQLNEPIVAMAAAPDGLGYWLAAGDGGVFGFGSGKFRGSMSDSALAEPIVAIAALPTTDPPGYVMVGGDGGVFSFPEERFVGSMADQTLRAPVVSLATTPTGNGYWLFAADGGVFAFGDAPFRGVYAGLAREWEQGKRRIMGGEFVGEAADRATWGYDLFSDRLPIERYRFVPTKGRR